MLRPVSYPEDPPARRDFHLALAGVVVPFVAFFLSASLALKNASAGEATPAQGAWTRRLVGLAVVDFLVLLSLIAVVAGKVALPAPPAPPGPRIGVVLDPHDRGEGAKVLSVPPGSPAEQAGIRAGDTVTAIDGKPVRNNAEMTAAIGATTPGEARTLALRRDGDVIEVPTRPAPATAPPSRPVRLFEPDGPEPPIGATLERLAAAWGAAVGLLALVSLIGARRSAPLDPSAPVLWVSFAGALAAANVALVGTTLALRTIVGGGSLGGALLGVFAGSGALLAISATWRPAPADRGPRRRPLAVTGVARRPDGDRVHPRGPAPRGDRPARGRPALPPAQTDPGAEIRELVRPGVDPAGIAILVLAAVVLAPVGEETLFRGVLLPWLRRFLSPDAAAWASAGIFAAGHLRYGPSMLVVVVYGLVLAWARMHTGRLRAPIALHMIINAAAMAFTLLRR